MPVHKQPTENIGTNPTRRSRLQRGGGSNFAGKHRDGNPRHNWWTVGLKKYWKDITDNGKSPLKCMPRQKAYKMDKKERAELAKNKQKAEKGNNTQKPTMTPTFKKEPKKASTQRVAYRYLIAKSKKNVPTKPELWDKVIEMAKGDRKSVSEGGVTVNAPNDGDGFEKYPTAYANGWASKVYGDLGGEWKVED